MPDLPGAKGPRGQGAKQEETEKEKKTTTAIGRSAEEAVCDWLRENGASILDTNIRAGRGEIDILARHGPVAIFVEVRTRGEGSYTTAFESITRDKRRRIVSAARVVWRTRLKKMGDIERLRFDVASVTIVGAQTNVEYVKGAFTEADC
jgi:putative endonuclease